MKKKVILGLLLVSMFGFTLTSCSQTSEDDSSSVEDSTDSSDSTDEGTEDSGTSVSGMVEMVTVTTKDVVVDEDDIDPSSFESSSYLYGGNVSALKPYQIGKYEVTQKLYEAVMKAYYESDETSINNPSHFKSAPAVGETQELRPVENVTFWQAIEFCNYLTLQTGGTETDCCYTIGYEEGYGKTLTVDLTKKGYRLPTMQEFEFAARGGNPNDAQNFNYFCAGGDNAGEVAWYLDNSSSITHEVGLKVANSLGIYDMSGNVQEWCLATYYDTISNDEIKENGYGTTMGGSYDQDDIYIQVCSCPKTKAVADNMDVARNNIGFRVARTL